MLTGDDAARFCSELLAGFADAGAATAFISPGSRNTPLTLAAIAEPRIRDLDIRDERAAGFMALGLAKTTAQPSIVICTSGSAAAHYLPAIVEADQSASPLLVVTSDRPERLRGTGAPQTMDQVELYGSHVKAFVAVRDGEDPRRIAVEAARLALSDPPGPVHLNVPFDEPLVPTGPIVVPDPRPVEPTPPAAGTPAGVFADLADRRVLIVASGRMRAGFAEAVDDLAARLDAPILADPQVAVAGPHVIHTSDLLVSAHDEEGRRLVVEAFPPEVIVRLGPIPTSKPIWRWLETNGIPQIHIESSRLADPLRSATTTVPMDPMEVLPNEPVPSNETGYAATWRSLDAIASSARDAALDRLGFPNEPEVARSVADHAPEGAILWLASSRPIRDVDAFARRRADRRVVANRGVNGIDGTISSAIGASLSGTPVVLLIGDVAALHDATSLAEAAALDAPLRIVVVNNDGGGIFELLPQATSEVVGRRDFERHWGTPHGLALSPIARAFGVQAWTIDDRDDLRSAVADRIGGPEVIEVVTDRSRLLEDHRRLRHAVAEALCRSDEIEKGP